MEPTLSWGGRELRSCGPTLPWERRRVSRCSLWEKEATADLRAAESFSAASAALRSPNKRRSTLPSHASLDAPRARDPVHSIGRAAAAAARPAPANAVPCCCCRPLVRSQQEALAQRFEPLICTEMPL